MGGSGQAAGPGATGGATGPETTQETPQTQPGPGASHVLRTAAGDRLGPVWRFAVRTGCRAGEPRALQWEDLDRRAGAVTVGRNLAARITDLRPPAATRPARGGISRSAEWSRTGGGSPAADGESGSLQRPASRAPLVASLPPGTVGDGGAMSGPTRPSGDVAYASTIVRRAGRAWSTSALAEAPSPRRRAAPTSLSHSPSRSTPRPLAGSSRGGAVARVRAEAAWPERPVSVGCSQTLRLSPPHNPW